eukprot:3341487-Pleurochrysis_carterae.AAC.1
MRCVGDGGGKHACDAQRRRRDEAVPVPTEQGEDSRVDARAVEAKAETQPAARWLGDHGGGVGGVSGGGGGGGGCGAVTTATCRSSR